MTEIKAPLTVPTAGLESQNAKYLCIACLICDKTEIALNAKSIPYEDAFVLFNNCGDYLLYQV